MYTIDINTNGYWVEVGHIDGCEAAYAAYRKACELGETLGVAIALTDAETGEVIAHFEGDEDEGAGIAVEEEPWRSAPCEWGDARESGPMLSNEFGEYWDDKT